MGLVIVLGLTSCEKYLDINYDPNSPTVENITVDMIMPGVEMSLAADYGNFLRITGGYSAQQYAQSFGTSNYLDYSKFNMSATRVSTTYTQLTTKVLNNIKTILELSAAKEEWGTYLAATTLRVFTYQVLVDAFGEVPYTEALDKTNLSPKYDDGQTIYNGILAELDEALSKASAADLVCTNFLFGTNTAAPWIKFANALKLRILMRMSNVANVQSQLAALVAENNFPTEDVAYDDCWTDELGKASPFYQEEYATYFGSTQINVILNLALLNAMQAYEDGRLEVSFAKNDAGEYTGGISGTNFSTSSSMKSGFWCRPVFKYDMPVNMITVSETEFFLAEYYARYGSETEAAAHYRNAVQASFESLGAEGADAAIAAYPFSSADYKRVIGIQKWIALGCMNNFEAWCEMRRLDYPAFGTVKGTDLYDEINDASYSPSALVPGTLYTPIKYYTPLGENKILERFPYAESSTSRNSNYGTQPSLSTPVFWGK